VVENISLKSAKLWKMFSRGCDKNAQRNEKTGTIFQPIIFIIVNNVFINFS